MTESNLIDASSQRPDAIVPRSTLPWFLRSAWQLFGAFFLVLGVLMGALAFLVSTQLRRSLEAQAVEQSALAARLITPVVEEHFEGLTKYVESFADRPLVRDFAQAQDVEGARAHLRDLVTQNPQFDRAFITDPEGVLWSDYPPSPRSSG